MSELEWKKNRENKLDIVQEENFCELVRQFPVIFDKFTKDTKKKTSLLYRVLGVLTCSRALCVCVLACSRAWRACVLTCLACLCAYVLGVFACVRACLLCWNVLFSYVLAVLFCLIYFTFQYSNLKILTAKKLCVLLSWRYFLFTFWYQLKQYQFFTVYIFIYYINFCWTHCFCLNCCKTTFQTIVPVLLFPIG